MKTYLVIVILAILLAGCTSPQAAPTPIIQTVIVTEIVQAPTHTPYPTYTPYPTSEPSSTPEPTPTPIIIVVTATPLPTLTSTPDPKIATAQALAEKNATATAQAAQARQGTVTAQTATAEAKAVNATATVQAKNIAATSQTESRQATATAKAGGVSVTQWKGVYIGMCADDVLEIHPKNETISEPELLGSDSQGLIVKWNYRDAYLVFARSEQGGIECYRVQEIYVR